MAEKLINHIKGGLVRSRTLIITYSDANPESVQKIINVASLAGAGIYQEYEKVAFLSQAEGNWLASPRATPHQGKPGEETRENSVMIFMTCATEPEIIEKVVTAILGVHLWEEPVIQLFPITEITKPNAKK